MTNENNPEWVKELNCVLDSLVTHSQTGAFSSVISDLSNTPKKIHYGWCDFQKTPQPNNIKWLELLYVLCSANVLAKMRIGRSFCKVLRSDQANKFTKVPANRF